MGAGAGAGAGADPEEVPVRPSSGWRNTKSGLKKLRIPNLIFQMLNNKIASLD